VPEPPTRSASAAAGQNRSALGSMTQWLNVLGMPGMTGYFGLMDVGSPSRARPWWCLARPVRWARPWGNWPDQGLPRGGHRRGRAKCDWVVNELGFDACIDYKAGNVKARG
jgi:hypothetical protein